MDRIGVVADLHGNLVALEAALGALRARGIDRLVCLGDVAAAGPRPREVLAAVRALGCPVVMGNADAWLLDPSPAPDDPDARRWWEIDAWGRAQLSGADLAYVATFAPTVAIALGSVRLLACHGSPRSWDEQLTADLPDGALDAALAGVEADLVLAGHTHLAMLRRHRAALLANPGSVGLPIDPAPPAPATAIGNPPWAEYAVVEADAAGALAVAFGRAPYDPDRLRWSALGSGMPHAEWWLADWRG